MDDLNDLYVNYNLTFKAVRVIDHTLMASEWKLKADVIYDDATADDETYDYQTNLAFAKIRYWFENIISRSVIWCRDDEWARNALISEDGTITCNNHLMVTPYTPTDDHLAELFQHKMNALADGAITFGAVELTSDSANGLSFVFVGEESNLPTMEEWIGEHSYFDHAWWDRNDASMLDVVPTDEADLTKPPSFAYSLDFLGEALRPAKLSDSKVIRPEFRPEIIEGGKK